MMPFHYYVIGAMKQDYAEWITRRIGRQVSVDELKAMDQIYGVFVMDQDKRRAWDAFATLMGHDAGRGLLGLKMEIARIDGMPDQAAALQGFIRQYDASYHPDASQG